MSDFNFVSLIVSTGLGFLSAIGVQELTTKFNNMRKYKCLKENLIVELEKVKEDVEQMEPEKVYLNPYNIPIWIGIRESGSMKYIEDQGIFLQLVDIFSTIEYRNAIESKCFEMCYGKNNYLEDDVVSLLNKGRKEVNDKVMEGIDILNKNK